MTSHVPPVMTISSTSSTSQQTHPSKQKSDYITCLLKTLQCLPIVFVVKISKAFNETSKLTFLTYFLPLPSLPMHQLYFIFSKWQLICLDFFSASPYLVPQLVVMAHILGLSINMTSYANHP